MKKVIAVVLAMMVFTGVAYAFGPWEGRSIKMNQGKMAERIIKELDLNQEQAEKFKAQEDKMEKDMSAYREKMKELSEKLKEAMEKDAPDKNAIHGTIKEIGQNMTDMRIKRADSMLELREVLTPDQKEKFKKMLDRKPKRARQEK